MKKGENAPRDGKLLHIQVDLKATGGRVTGDSILERLRADGVEVDQFNVRVYDTEQLGWTTLRKDVTFDALSSPPRRIDIQVIRGQGKEQHDATD